MSKFVFYQTISSEGNRTNHGILLEGKALQEALERIYTRHEEAMSVAVLGTAECDRLIPVVVERGNNTPTDADEGLDLNHPRWEGDTLEAMEKLLEEQK